jgi:hypothetical protein
MEKFETARKMINDQLSLDSIMKYTGLTREEVEAVRGDR